MSPPAATYMRPGAGQYIYCRYRSVRPRSLPAESHSFVGMARETAAMPPAYQGSFTSIQMVHTHTLHHQHNMIDTTLSTQHHLAMYTTSSNTTQTTYTPTSTHHHQTQPQPHQHITNTIATRPSTLCLIPADTPVVVLCCALFFVLFHR